MESDHNNSMSLGIIKKKKKEKPAIKQGMPSSFKDGDPGWGWGTGFGMICEVLVPTPPPGSIHYLLGPNPEAFH